MRIYAAGIGNESSEALVETLRRLRREERLELVIRRSMPAGGAIPGPILRSSSVVVFLEGWSEAEARLYAFGSGLQEPTRLEVPDDVLQSLLLTFA